jgi:4-amino-4-deoxy-L-arabinose transferase-like glycosyltransferase
MSPNPTAEKKRPLDASILLFVLAWLIGLVGSVHPGTFGFGRGFEMASIARCLVERGAFANPFYPSITGPSAFVPPLYPLFLASLVHVFGWPLPGALIASVAFNAITAALMPRLSKILVQDARPGILAGCLWMTSMPLMPQWDASWTIACLVLTCIFTSQSMVAPCRSDALKTLASGILGGLISLLNPVALVPFALWVGFLLYSRRVPWKSAARYMAAVLLIVAACNAPWVLRNYRIWHALVLRTNFGTTFYSSNNDCAVSSSGGVGLTGCYQRTYPGANESELQLMKRLGEVAYDRQKTADAMAWIRAHPARFGQLTMQRIAEFWFPSPVRVGLHVYAIWAITLLSIPGIVLMIRHREKAAWFFLWVWIVYPLVYYVVYSSDRYRYPILWTSLLPAGYYLAHTAPLMMRILRPARLSRQT